MENKLSNTIVLPPILRLPPEIRLKIYRLLLLSKITLRMQWPQDEDYDRPANYLFPAILRTCQLIHGEAIDVLYRENVFRAHRINNHNKNAALITRVKFTIGTGDIENAEMDASNLEKFVNNHPNLKLLKLEFGSRLLENSKIRNILSAALFGSAYSSALRVLSDFKSTRSSSNEAPLVETVETVVCMNQTSFRNTHGIVRRLVVDRSEEQREWFSHPILHDSGGSATAVTGADGRRVVDYGNGQVRAAKTLLSWGIVLVLQRALNAVARHNWHVPMLQRVRTQYRCRGTHSQAVGKFFEKHVGPVRQG